MLVFAIAPIDRQAALAETAQERASAPAVQTLAATGDHSVVVERESYSVTKPVPVVAATRTAPAAGVPDPGSAKAIAYQMVTARGWGQAEYDCLVALWNKESGWNVYAHNVSSGAYGIPQALPGKKMESAGADWATNPATQISWGLGYISGIYGTPCGAWSAAQAKGWY